MNQYIAAIRAETKTYKEYLRWSEGEPTIQAYYMMRSRKNWECYAAIYRVKRRAVLKVA